MKTDTILAQAGSRWDERTGAVTMPVYQTATFRHPELGKSTGFDYSRSANPTRQALEETLATLDKGAAGFAFASGLAAVDALLALFEPGSELIVTEDLYGGTFRLFEKVHSQRGLKAIYVDTSDYEAVERAFDASKNVKGLFIETPTNPLLKVADIERLCALAEERGALSIVDNTFLTPLLCRPIELGADLTVYSASKYLAGHNDVVAGAVVASTTELGEKVYFYQNAIGGVLGPQDSWLLTRGLKTLSLRMERQQKNALKVAKFLEGHERVSKVYYPGLPAHPGHELIKKHSSGYGAMVAAELALPEMVPDVLKKVAIFHFAESLGGVESLITYPAVQTHADIAPETLDRLGINNRLLRLSIGVEDADDLIEDLDRALS